MAVLARLLGDHQGWHHLHPLEHHPHRGPWRWETASLLLEVRGPPRLRRPGVVVLARYRSRATASRGLRRLS